MTDDPTYQDSDGCQGTPVSGGAAVPSRPVDPTDTDAASDLIEHVLRTEAPEGAPLVWLARQVFGDDVSSADADWKWVRRECDRQGHRLVSPRQRFAVDGDDPDTLASRASQPGYTWVVPRWADDDVLDTASCISANPRSSRNADTFLGGRRVVSSAREWGDLVGAFGGKRLGERRGARRGSSGLLPSRFNSLGRALAGCDRLRAAFAGASALGFGEGVVVTGTTAPGRYGSLRAASGSLVDDAKRLREKAGGPPGVTVVEPTARGVPHVHVALFGVTTEDLPSRRELKRYWWVTRERGQQVDVQPIRFGGDAGRWGWASEVDAASAGCPPLAYLLDGSASVAAAARASAWDVLSVARAFRRRGDEEFNSDVADDVDAAVSSAVAGAVDARAVRWAAWHWATGLKTVTRPSPALRAAASTGTPEGAA